MLPFIFLGMGAWAFPAFPSPISTSPSAYTCSQEDSLESGLSLEALLVTMNGDNYPVLEPEPLHMQGDFCPIVLLLPAGWTPQSLGLTHTQLHFQDWQKTKPRRNRSFAFSAFPEGICFVSWNLEGIDQHLEAKEKKCSIVLPGEKVGTAIST